MCTAQLPSLETTYKTTFPEGILIYLHALSWRKVEEVALRCPDVDVAQRCSSSAQCPLLITLPKRD